MIHFSHPIVLLLAVPAWFLLRRGWQARGVQSVLRAALVVIVVIVAAGPTTRTVQQGTTVVFVFDRSRSMPATIDRQSKELMRRAESEIGPGDQLAAIGFGAAPLVEQFPAVGHPPETGLRRIDPEQSNLHAAVAAALDLVRAGEQGRLIVISDGLADDELTDSLAEQLRRRRVLVSFSHAARRSDGDVVLESVTCPTAVKPGEEITFEFEITSSVARTASLRIRRDADDVPAHAVELDAGTTQFAWTDQPATIGVLRYAFLLDASGDPAIENNQWDTWVLVRGEPTVLILSDDGADSPLAELVRRSGAAVQLVAAKHLTLSAEQLSGFDACVIEDVPAGDLAAPTVEALTRYVEQLGGGLVVSGGAKGIGAGGYRFGPLEPLLPVTLRSLSARERPPIALAVVVDMNAWEGIGSDDDQLTPFQKAIIALAQELDPTDRITITATRSPNQVLLTLSPANSPHVIRDAVDPLSVPGDPTLFPKALEAAWDILAKAPQPEKHLVACIGADQFQAWQSLNDGARAARVGASATIVSWGSIAESWQQISGPRAKSKVRHVSATDASQLEQLFRQDFEVRAGGGYVARETAMLPASLPGAAATDKVDDELPAAPGFHPAMSRVGSRATLVTRDNPNVPLAAEWERGMGRVSVLLFPVERGTSSDAQWDRLARVLVPQLQWTARLQDAARGTPISVERKGRGVDVSVRLDDNALAARPSSGPLELVAVAADENAARVTMQNNRVATRLDAHIELVRPTGCVPVVRRGETFVLRGPPVTLPRSPEFLKPATPASADHSPEPASRGRETLERLAELSGGGEWNEAMPLFGESAPAYRSLVPIFAWLAIALLLVDIADRRHHVLERLEASWRRPRPRSERPSVSAAPVVQRSGDVFEKAKEQTRRRLQR